MNGRPDKDERGFTLAELMIVIALIGILAAIAVPSWFGLIQSREVESAANQLAADLRLAHNSATNRLEEWRFTQTSTNGYEIQPVTGGSPRTRPLPEGTAFDLAPPSSLIFCANGKVFVTSGSTNCNDEATGTLSLRVSTEDGEDPRNIEINAATSRVEIVD